MERSRYENPIPTRASKHTIWDFAEEVARNLEFVAGDPIEPIVAEIGGRISYDNPVDEDVPETIRVEPNSRFEIFLPALTSATRDRFTVAHELGHFFLHFPLVQDTHPGKGMRATRWVDANDRDLERCEWEANWFAAAFVMPAKQFQEVYSSLGVAEAAALFGVSQKAAEIRAKSLNLA
jgi:predicted transcriptional regulator